MTNRRNWFDWISEKNSQQQEWAASYLRKKGWVSPYFDKPHLYLQNVDQQWQRIGSAEQMSEQEQFVAKMRVAWSKQLSRKRRRSTEKPYSFEMSPEAGPALKRLSRTVGLSISQTLEALILETEDFRRSLEARKNEEEARIRFRQRGISNNAEQQKQQLSAQKQMAHAWQAAAEDLLAQGARYQIALKTKGLLDGNRKLRLDPQQEVAADKLQKRWKNALKTSVMTNARLAGLDN